jgi:single-strand DNA-binding protein
MYNKTILVGFLAKAPEVRYTPDGKPIGNVTVASNHKYGERKETLFLDCVIFGKSAEFAGQYLDKGSLVLVEGRLSEKTWEDSMGEKKKKFQLIVNDIKSLSKREERETKTENKAENKAAPETDDLEAF